MDYVPVNRYARGPEILAHCQAIARRYQLYDLAVFHTTVTGTTWDDEAALWRITTDRGDSMRARFVICANGTLSKPKLSRIEGMDTFRGHAFHTSRWDYAYTGATLEHLRDKTVGIIGTGATAVQAIPELARQARALYVFQRTPSSIDVREDWPTDPNWARRLKPGWQHQRRAKVLAAFERSPEETARLAALSPEEKLRRQENANIDHMMRIHARIDAIVENPETAAALKPWYMFMCKRPCFHNDYLPTFNRSNVHLVDTRGKGITRITPAGPVFEDREYPVDLLIYATGFEVQKTGIYNRILGRHGLDLEDKYADGIRTLLGIHTHGFPNLFIMGGYQASFQFNLTDMLQTQGDHIAACIDHVRQHGYRTLDVTETAESWWVDEVIRHRGKTNRNAECTPGYYNFEGESNRRQDGNYNGGFRQYFEHQGAVRARMSDHFQFTNGARA
jgi:cation diffusion facilitator CzcD-associated flavoprotein CzcO